MTNNWQRKFRIYNLTVSGNQSSKKRTEADHDKPVCNSGCSEVEHLGVAQNLLQHIFKSRPTITAARWIRLALAINRNQLWHTNRQHPQRNDSDQVRKGGQGDMHKARLPSGAGIYVEGRELYGVPNLESHQLNLLSRIDSG